MKNKKPDYTDFPGFQRFYDFNHGGFIMYPTMLEQYWWSMTGSEQKCMDYIIRRTIGWQKDWDQISLAQFKNGVGGKGKDKGTGLSVSQIRRALKGLKQKGFITILERKNRASQFNLVLVPSPSIPDDVYKGVDLFKKKGDGKYFQFE